MKEAWRYLRQQPLHNQLRLLRWNAPMIVLALAALQQLFVQTVIRPLETPLGWWLEVLVYTLTGSIAVWWGLSYIVKSASRQAETERELRIAFAELEDNHQKLLTLDRYGRYIADAPNEDEVYKVAVQAPTHLAEAQSTTLITFDEEKKTLNLAMAWGLSDAYAQNLRTQLSKEVPSERCRTCTVLHAHVESDCPLFQGMQKTAKEDGIHSLVCVPINTEQERVGVLTAYFPSADGPKEEQARLLNILGGVIAFAVDSLRARERQIDALQSLDSASRARQSLEGLASQTLQAAMLGWKAQAGAVFLYQAQDERWISLAREGLGDFSSPRFNFAQQLAQQTYQDQAIMLQPSIGDDPAHGLGSAAALPLISDGETFGVLFLGTNRPLGLQQSHVDLLQTIAHQIALALRNAQLYDELRQTTMLRERYRLAREFHDGLAQTLGYLGLQIDRLERLFQRQQYDQIEREMGELRHVVRSAYVDVREAIDGLRLRWDDPERLAENLANYVQDFAMQTGIEVAYTASPENLIVSTEISAQMLRIAQEALTNIRKHAQADRAEVSLAQTANKLTLRVADNGVGFPVSDRSTSNNHRSYGLSTMRERADSIGGLVSVVAGPGQGTVITVTVPHTSPSPEPSL